MFWFNRMAEHWVVPQRLDLVEHVRRGRLQVVQTGTFGPQFYGLADDPEVDRSCAELGVIDRAGTVDVHGRLLPGTTAGLSARLFVLQHAVAG